MAVHVQIIYTYILRGQLSGLGSLPPPVTNCKTSWFDWPGYG